MSRGTKKTNRVITKTKNTIEMLRRNYPVMKSVKSVPTSFPADPIVSERGSDGMIPCAA